MPAAERLLRPPFINYVLNSITSRPLCAVLRTWLGRQTTRPTNEQTGMQITPPAGAVYNAEIGASIEDDWEYNLSVLGHCAVLVMDDNIRRFSSLALVVLMEYDEY